MTVSNDTTLKSWLTSLVLQELPILKNADLIRKYDLFSDKLVYE
jgi:hypothetical protein